MATNAIDMLMNLFVGMTAVEEIRIVSNKIDRIEDYALPSQNTVRRLILEGNHILEVPSLSALEEIQVEKVVKIFLELSSALHFCTFICAPFIICTLTLAFYI